MAEATAVPVVDAEGVHDVRPVPVAQIFLEFLIIGATSFGGAVPYLRNSLVAKRGWIDDKEFVEMLSISQSLPGLNATNMAILVGEKLRGWLGSAVAILGICLPGGVLMYAVGVFYHLHGDHVWATAALKGVAAAAVAMNQIPALSLVFAYLSILTVGGGMAAFPEMKVLTVDVHQWLTFPQLIHIYSVGQMAPGPNG